MFLFATQHTSFLVFYCTNMFFFWCAFWVYLKSLNGSTQSVVLFGSFLLNHSKMINGKIVSPLNIHNKRSNQKALQF